MRRNPYIGPKNRDLFDKETETRAYVPMDREEIKKAVQYPVTPQTEMFFDARNYSDAEWRDLDFRDKQRIKKYTLGLIIDKYGGPEDSYGRKYKPDPSIERAVPRVLKLIQHAYLEAEELDEGDVGLAVDDAGDLGTLLDWEYQEDAFFGPWRVDVNDFLEYVIQESEDALTELPGVLNDALLGGAEFGEPSDWAEAYLQSRYVETLAESALEQAREIADYIEDPPEDEIIEGAKDDFRDGGYWNDDELRRRFAEVYSGELEEWVEEAEQYEDEEGEPITEDMILEELGTVLQDEDLYEWSVGGGGMVFGNYRPGGFYMSDDDVRKIERRMEYESLALRAIEEYGPDNYKDEIKEALINGRGVEIWDDYHEGFEAYGDPDLEAIKTEVWERLGLDDAEPLTEEERVDRESLVASGPIEDRIVCRPNHPDFPNVYVVDLTPDELKDEGRGPPEQEGVDADGQRGLSHCIGHEVHGHPRQIRRGRRKAFSVRRPPSKRKGMRMFTIEAEINKQGEVTRILEIKGLANRLPGYEITKQTGRYGADTRPKKKLGEVDLMVHIIQECFGLDPHGINDMRPGLKLLADKQWEEAKKREERRRARAEREENPGETYLYDYSDFTDLDVELPTKTTCGPWEG